MRVDGDNPIGIDGSVFSFLSMPHPNLIVLFVCCDFQSKDAIDTMMFYNAILFGFCTFCLIFFLCELGQQFTNILGKVFDEFQQLNWYLFPSEIQHMLPTIITSLEMPVVVGCFNIFYGSREQFKEVRLNFKFNTNY